MDQAGGAPVQYPLDQADGFLLRIFALDVRALAVARSWGIKQFRWARRNAHRSDPKWSRASDSPDLGDDALKAHGARSEHDPPASTYLGTMRHL